MSDSKYPRATHDLSRLESLAERGVILPAPHLVVIGAEVELERIESGAVLHPFCRITGRGSRVGAGAIIGQGGAVTLEEAVVGTDASIGTLGPVLLRNTVCGPRTSLGCGQAEEAVFLGREGGEPAFTAGYGFRVRRGSLYEEGANSAQFTDTKMTLLFPWVTLGSNINWCDVLVSGGTGPGLGEFSEVGSGTIHFNFTPRGDKATASLFGEGVRGLFLNQPRLFIGGNGSMIGPISAGFDTATAAGARFSGSLTSGLNPGEPPSPGGRGRDYDPDIYGSVKRLFDTQVTFIAQLAALEGWYGQARPLVARGDREREELYAAGRETVRLNIAERITQLGRLAGKMDKSAALLEQKHPHDPRIVQHRSLVENWPRLEKLLLTHCEQQGEIPAELATALEENSAREGRVYTRVIQSLPPQAVKAGVEWLRGVAGGIASPELLNTVQEVGSTL